MKKTESTKFLYSRLVNTYVKKYNNLLIYAAISMIIVALTNGINTEVIKPLIDDIFVKQNKSMLPIITSVVLISSLIKGFALFFENYFMKKLGQSIIVDMQVDLYKHLINSDLKFLNSYSSGKLISRFSVDIQSMKSTVSTTLAGLARDLVSLIVLVYVMFTKDWLLTLLVLFVFPLAVYPIILIGKRMRKVATKTQEELSNYTVQLDETFQKIRIIKSFVREKFEITRSNNIINGILGLYLKAAKIESLSSPIMGIFTGIAIAFVTWYGGNAVITGKSTPGTFFAFLTAFFLAYRPIKTLTDLNSNLQEGLAAARRYFALLDTPQEVIDYQGAKDITISDSEISFQDVTFGYNNETKVLNNFNIKIPGGKKIAIVGESGSGKSTLTNLLLRLYDIESGVISIDNQDISKVTLNSLRNSISIVTQETAIFDDSLKHNIMYGDFEASHKDFTKAAEMAMVDEFANELPELYDSKLGQNGMTISGGQRQRVAIARALLKNSHIMILDEATSALDNITESNVMNNITEFRKGKTTIVIAHRLSTIIDSDIIYVMKDGEVVEYGTHTELINNKNHYSNLYNKEEN